MRIPAGFRTHVVGLIRVASNAPLKGREPVSDAFYLNLNHFEGNTINFGGQHYFSHEPRRARSQN